MDMPGLRPAALYFAQRPPPTWFCYGLDSPRCPRPRANTYDADSTKTLPRPRCAHTLACAWNERGLLRYRVNVTARLLPDCACGSCCPYAAAALVAVLTRFLALVVPGYLPFTSPLVDSARSRTAVGVDSGYQLRLIHWPHYVGLCHRRLRIPITVTLRFVDCTYVPHNIAR